MNSQRNSLRNTNTKLVQKLDKTMTQKASNSQLKKNSSIGEEETWLEGIKTYKSVINPRKTYSHHIDRTVKDSQQKPYQRNQTTNQNGVVRCAQVCD